MGETRSILEYERVERASFCKRALGRLRRFDESFAGSSGHTIFDWSREKYLRAVNYVGVIQVPGLTVEILPKIDGGRGRPNPVA